jgi:hypothetical protein
MTLYRGYAAVKRSSSMAICIGIVLTICVTISIFPSQTIDKFNAAVTNATQFVDNEDGNKKQPSGTASERFIFIVIVFA